MAVQARYRFGPFSLDPATRRLLRETEQVPLSPKAFDLLVLLVVNRSRVVSKQELLDAVWEDTAVVENSLTQRIKELRTALSDPAQSRDTSGRSRAWAISSWEKSSKTPRPLPREGPTIRHRTSRPTSARLRLDGAWSLARPFFCLALRRRWQSGWPRDRTLHRLPIHGIGWCRPSTASIAARRFRLTDG